MVSVPVNRSPARQRMLQLVELARMPELRVIPTERNPRYGSNPSKII